MRRTPPGRFWVPILAAAPEGGRIFLKPLFVPIERFHFEKFVQKIYVFLRERLGEPEPSRWIQAMGPDFIVFEDRDSHDVYRELQEGWSLFFPFALPDMTGGTLCADGEDYATWQVLEREGAISEEREYLVDDINELGFILQKKPKFFVIRAGILCGGLQAGPAPYVEQLEDAGLFEPAMSDFLKVCIADEASP